MKKRTTRGGIYTRVQITLNLGDGDLIAPAREAIKSYDLTHILDVETKRASAVLQHNGIEWPEHPGTGASPTALSEWGDCHGANQRKMEAARRKSPEAGDAWELLEHIEELREAIAAGLTPPMPLLFAYRMGRLAERLTVRPHEPDALRGKRSAKGAAKGRQSHKRQAEQDAAFYRDALKTRLTEKPYMSLTKARQSIAAEHGISLRTIERYTSSK